MLAVQLPPEVEDRLYVLSRRTGRSRDEHVREAILENLEDVALADERLDALRRGAGTVLLTGLMKRYGVGE